MAVYRRESRRRPIIALIVITCLALITLDHNGNGVIGSVRHNAQDAIAPVQNLVDNAFDPVTNVFDGVTKVDGLESENARLRCEPLLLSFPIAGLVTATLYWILSGQSANRPE